MMKEDDEERTYGCIFHGCDRKFTRLCSAKQHVLKDHFQEEEEETPQKESEESSSKRRRFNGDSSSSAPIQIHSEYKRGI